MNRICELVFQDRGLSWAKRMEETLRRCGLISPTDSEKIILGTANFGMNYGINNSKGQLEEREVFRLLDIAWYAGIRMLDTAPGYGATEEVIGRYIKNSPEKTWRLISKCHPSMSDVEKQIENTRKKTGITPGVVLVHSGGVHEARHHFQTLVRLKKEGVVPKIGISIYQPDDMRNVLAMGQPDIIQVPLSILDTRLYRSGFLYQLKSMGIEVHARSVFLQGLLSFSKAKINDKFPQVSTCFERLTEVAKKQGLSLATYSLAWVNSLNSVDKIVIGVDTGVDLMSNVAQVKAGSKTIEFDEALALKFDDELVLNPNYWP